jgi:hypothetical protein
MRSPVAVQTQHGGSQQGDDVPVEGAVDVLTQVLVGDPHDGKPQQVGPLATQLLHHLAAGAAGDTGVGGGEGNGGLTCEAAACTPPPALTSYATKEAGCA